MYEADRRIMGPQIWKGRWAAMKTVLRVAVLMLCALTGLLVTGHGIALAVLIHTPGHPDVMRHLIEGSISIAGGACVMSVAFDQLECLRAHRKRGNIL